MPNEERREKSVVRMMNKLSERAKELEEKINGLEQSLVNGLRQSDPVVDTEKLIETAEPTCEHENQLKGILLVLGNSTEKIASILNRLEV